ncbi:MAG: hypothetical protein Q8P31_08260 [Bacillota bacterium]|nr:hypothetical protein [Bacillota bacterium]
MAHFTFRLQRVLALREAEAKRAKTAAAAAAAASHELEQQLERAASVMHNASEPFRASPRGARTASGAQLAAAAAYLGRTRDEAAEAAVKLQEAYAVQAEGMALARQAWGDAEALSNLRDRRQRIWQSDELAAQQREIDDLSAAGRARQAAGPAAADGRTA